MVAPASSQALQSSRLTDLQIVGCANLVIIGTVTSVSEIPDAPDATNGQAVIAIEKILQGTAATTVTMRYPLPPKSPSAGIATEHSGITLQPGDRKCFILQEGQDAYTPVAADQGVRSADQAPWLAESLRLIQLKVSFTNPLGPIYIGQTVPMTIHVTNTGTSPMYIDSVTITGQFSSDIMGSTLPMREKQQEQEQLAKAHPEPLEIVGGATIEKTFLLTTVEPGGWQIYGAESYIITPVAVRVMVSVRSQKAPFNDALSVARAALAVDRNRFMLQKGYTACSPWMHTTFGYTASQ